MQTFLPYRDFQKTARCLDYRRLGKQRVEALQILRALQKGPGAGWYNHPAVKMWRGHENALREYLNAMIDEWVGRGYKNNIQRRPIRGKIDYPRWLGRYKFHSSHRAALLKKLPAHYRQFRWNERPDINYYWPLPKRRGSG